MAREVVYVGGRMDSVEVASGTPTDTSTTSLFDTAYVSGAIATSATNGGVVRARFRDSAMAATDIVVGETLYYHFEFACSTNTSTAGRDVAKFCNSSDQPLLSIRAAGSTSLGLYYNSGTAASPVWTLIGSTWGIVASTRYTIDVAITLGSPHTVSMWHNGSLITNAFTFTLAGITTLQYVSHSSASGSGSAISAFSQMMATRDIPTVGAKVAMLLATGAGALTGWTGAYTDVNEAATSDTTVNTAGAPSLQQSYPLSDVTVPGGMTIKSVWHWLRAKNDGSSPLNVKSLVRLSSTNYVSGSLGGVGTGFGATAMRYDTDPSTSATWSQSNVNSAEFGFESAA